LKRRGSISAAADECRIGQPSATKHLKTLEAAVGKSWCNETVGQAG
jgi:DNA-binding transcriptional LysR family regulator